MTNPTTPTEAQDLTRAHVGHRVEIYVSPNNTVTGRLHSVARRLRDNGMRIELIDVVDGEKYRFEVQVPNETYVEVV